MSPWRIWFDEDGTPLWSCKECATLLWDELCPRHFAKETRELMEAQYA